MSTIQTKLKPGTYRLTVDMPALRDDKRRTRDWRCQPMELGTLFFYTEWTYSPCDDETKVTEHRLYPVRCHSSESVSPNETYTTRLLEESLMRVEETPSLWLRREHSSRTALGVLDTLFTSGKLTLADVQTATAAYLENTIDD